MTKQSVKATGPLVVSSRDEKSQGKRGEVGHSRPLGLCTYASYKCQPSYEWTEIVGRNRLVTPGNVTTQDTVASTDIVNSKFTDDVTTN